MIGPQQDAASRVPGHSPSSLIDPRVRDEEFRFRFIRLMSGWLGGFIAVTIFVRTVFFTSKPFTAVLPVAISILLLLLPRLMRSGKSNTKGGYFLIFALTLVGLWAGIGNGGIRAPATIVFILMPLVGILSLGKRGGQVALGIAAASLIFLVAAEHLGWILPLDRGLQHYLALILFVGAMINYTIGAVYENSRRKSEKMLLELTEQLSSRSKFSALGEMAGGVAHEINNPLAIIQGKAWQLKQRLEKGSVDQATLIEELEKIEATTERIARIIKGLRSISRNSEGDAMQAVVLSRVLDDAVGICHERFRERSIELRLNCDADVEVECRASQILQVILNLLNNAYDAVEILPEKWVELSARAVGSRVEILVTDSGRGIPPEIVGKLMEPFFTTKEVGKGTGIGLSISKGIVSQHHGRLRYDPSFANTRFILELPLRQSVRATAAA